MTALLGAEPAPRVLLVDDDQLLLGQMALLLAEFDISVVATADRGDRAVAAMRWAAAHEEWVDVVVMDVRMPGALDGLDATRVLRRRWPDTPVILHSAFAGCLGGQADGVGAFAEIAKGAHPNDLVDTIFRAFETSRRQRSRLAAGAG